jgi:predicted nucleotidyltransferase
MKSNAVPDNIVNDVIPSLRQFCVGEYGIAVGGSYAKGVSDEQSDVDIYLFANQILPRDQRSTLMKHRLNSASQIISWGDDALFVEGGTDFWYAGRKVECWLRNMQRIEKTLQMCLNGQIDRGYVVWTVMGFYNYVALSDIHVMQIIEDPNGILGGWKDRLDEYPAALRKAIIGRYLAEVQFWPENFHYLSAIERGDILYTTGIVQQVVYAMIQVVFALNRVYFPGEKKVGMALEKLALQPGEFNQRIRELVYPGDIGSITYLRAQQEALSRLANDVKLLVQDEDNKGIATS